MDPKNAQPDDALMTAAEDAWRAALTRYIDLARAGANRTSLKAAAVAVHKAAIERNRLLPPADDAA